MQMPALRRLRALHGQLRACFAPLEQHRAAAQGAPAPFRVEVSQDEIQDINYRLDHTRWPNGQLEGGDWRYGANLEFIQRLCAYWRSNFDWQAMVARLNAFPQFKLPVETERGTISIHFIHAVSPHANAKPLLLTHGWPGSVFEFHKIIPMLTEPENHGGSAEQAFHVVAPSIPGYGFSSAPTRQ